MKKMKRNHQILKILMVPILHPSKISQATLDLSIKCLILLGDKYDFSVFCLLYFINSLISREHLPHLLL